MKWQINNEIRTKEISKYIRRREQVKNDRVKGKTITIREKIKKALNMNDIVAR